MIKAVGKSLSFMTQGERIRWYTLTIFRALLAILDLVGVMAIGFVVTSTALFLTSGSDPNRVLEFAGLSLPAANAQSLPFFAAAIVALFLIKAFLAIWLTKKTAFFIAMIEARAAKQIAETVFGSDLEIARGKSREELMYAIQIGSPAAFNQLLNIFATIIAEGTLFLLICIGFFFVDVWATIGAIAYFAIIGLVIQFFVGSLMNKAGKVAAESSVRGNVALTDLVSVFRELVVLGSRGKYIHKLYQARIASANSSATQIYLTGMPRYIIEAALLVGIALFVLAQALAGDIVASAGTLGVFLSGGFRLTASMLPLQSALLQIKGAHPLASTAHEVLELKNPKGHSYSPEINSFDRGSSYPVEVDLRDVSYTYSNPSNPVIHNLTAHIPAGSQVAIIGASGTGKSTIADLICGVIQPTAGQVILAHGGSGASTNPAPASVSYVPQKPGLVSGTIAENVALAVDQIDIDQVAVLDALKRAHLEEVVAQLPDGIDSDLGKLQDGLSGGQIQRLGLARALYPKPGLLVMDEATSALDAESEAEINKALNEMRGSVTVVLIAHRLNTVQHCDKVFLIDQGKVVDEGTFQELLARNPAIKRLVELMRVDEAKG